jgi:hypothetical protein
MVENINITNAESMNLQLFKKTHFS